MKRNLESFIQVSLAVFVIFLICFSSEAGILKGSFSFKNITPKEELSGEMVNAIAVQGEEVWFGIYAGGATLYDKSKNSFKAYTTKGEPMDGVDRGESIKWQNLLPYNHVSVIVPDSDRIWFGTNFYGFGGGGVSYYSPQKDPAWKCMKVSVLVANDNRAKKIVSMAIDGNQLWVGSEKGLSLLDKKTETWKAFYSLKDGLAGNVVNSVLVEPDCLWLGTSGGINRFDKVKKTWKTYSRKEGLSEIEIKSIVRTGQKIWAGSNDGGLFEYRPSSDTWQKIEGKDSLKGGGIYSMTLIKDNLYICRDNGVSIYDLPTGKWESLTVSDGLLSNMVFCAVEDRDGIWFGTDKGASHLILGQ